MEKNFIFELSEIGGQGPKIPLGIYVGGKKYKTKIPENHNEPSESEYSGLIQEFKKDQPP